MALLLNVVSPQFSCLSNNNQPITSKHALIAAAAAGHHHHHHHHVMRVPSLMRKQQQQQQQQQQHGSYYSSLIKCVSTKPSQTTTTTTSSDAVLKRSDFPADFMIGATSSSIQTEGTEGRGANTWDSFIPDGGLAVDSLHKYAQDVEMLKFMGADAYRLGISWSRLFPEGSGTVNQEALDFYNKFIDLLIQNGITPFVTLFHFNVPVALQKKYDGFLSDNIVADYANFADTCFKNFGDRVKHWVTFNEPQVWSVYGYKTKMTAKDDPTRNPYIVAHNIIVSHATVVKNYRENYQGSQGGEIGMSLSTQWNLPYENSPEHIDACGRAWDFHFGWFAEPMIAGDYPFIMKALVRDRLRAFTTEEKELIKGSCDFIGINYYTSRFAQALPIDTTVDVPTSYDKDQYLNALSTNSSGESIGPTSSGSSQINVYPAGIRDVLRHTKNHYKSPKIYITENGYPTARNDKNPTWKELEDDDRIEFIESHLRNVRDAQRIDGVDVNGYLVWALMDNVEWGSGYNVRFGLSFIDYNNDLMRYPKKSAKWLRDFNMEDKETNGSVTSTTTSTE